MHLKTLCTSLALSICAACNPQPPDPGESASSTSTSTTDSSSGSDTGSSSTTIDPTGAPSTGTTAPIEPCDSHLAEADCGAAGCVWFATETVPELATCELAPAGACVDASASTGDEEYDSAFFKIIGGVVHLRRVGHKGCDFLGADHPDGWTECGVGPDDPPECACVCAAGQCPGDVALAALEACALPRPCADIFSEGGEFGWEEEDCLYKALAAGDAGELRVTISLGDPVTAHRVYLRGDGHLTAVSSTCDASCVGSCDDRTWSLPRSCTLREPAYFDTCANSDDLAVLAGCRDVSTWSTDCADAPPTCP